jgi:23S rRNA (cytosine1962-C5)-methyltransferase
MAIDWTKINQKLSGLEDKPIRWILDDAMVFLKREIKRGNTYDAIVMDPPGIWPWTER